MPADGKAVTATIVDLTHDGEGVADIDGHRVFVPETETPFTTSRSWRAGVDGSPKGTTSMSPRSPGSPS